MLLLCALIVGSGSVWAENKTLTFVQTSTSAGTLSGDVPTGVTATFSNTYNTKDQLTNNNSMTLTLSGWDVNTTIKGVTLEVKNNKSSGNGTATVSIGETTLGTLTITGLGSTYQEKEVEITETKTTTALVIYIECPSGKSNNSVYCDKFIVTYEEGGDPADTRTATTVDIDASGLTNTNKYTGTDAGTLAATVKAGETTVGNSVTWSSDNDEVATINASTGVVTLVAAGTVTFTASYAGDDDYKPSTNTYELTVINDNPNAITLWSEDFSTSGYSTRSTTYSYVTTGSSAVQASDSYAGGEAPEMMVKASGTFQATIPLNNVQGSLELKYRTNAKSLTVSTTTDGIEGEGTFNTLGEHTVTFTGITTSMTSITIVFEAGNANARLDDIVLKGSLITPVTVSSAGYATFASAYPVDYSDVDGLTAYTASTDGENVSFSAAGKVPAENGVLIKAAAGTYNVPVIATASAITNEFVGVTKDTAVDESIYVLYNGTKGVGFYRTTADSFTVGAYTAYLRANVVTEARAFIWFDEEGETTGIQKFEGSKMNFEGYYNLNGQQVVNPTKGLYIANGKKVIIK